MKKLATIAVLATALAAAFVLAACATAELSVLSDNEGVHAVASNGAEGAGTGNITVEKGYGLCINHVVERGSFHVKAVDEQGTVVFDEDLTDNVADLVEVDGEFNVEISAQNAVGTVDIIPYDIEAQAQAEAAKPEMLGGEGGSESAQAAQAGIANPWSDVESAQAAAEGAGVGSFALPENGTEINGGRIDLVAYRYMDMLAEADGYVGTAELVVRKGVNRPAADVGYDPADVSGDYNEYAHDWQIEAAGWQVKCFGNEEGKTMKAIWQSDNFSYSIMVRGQGDIHDTYGLSDDDVAALVSTIE